MYKILNYIDCNIEQHREILRMRNLDAIRKWMVNQELISEDDHLNFVNGLRNQTDRKYYAVYKDDILVGTYNLTKKSEGVWERGIIANPIMQGKGETEKWERQILNSLSKEGISTINAKVKQDNLRSIRYHIKLGFRETNSDNEYIHFKLTL